MLLSLKIYLDDCAYTKKLVMFLRSAGHHVVTPADAGTSKVEDVVHFQFAVSQDLVLLTKNPKDFDDLHNANPRHPGILVIYQDNDPDRDMTLGDIVRSIANLETAGVPIPGNYHILNSWRY